jgi:hypothetical protein
MALTTMDPEFDRHYQSWIGFTRFMRYMLVLVVMTLALLGYFLA